MARQTVLSLANPHVAACILEVDDVVSKLNTTSELQSKLLDSTGRTLALPVDLVYEDYILDLSW